MTKGIHHITAIASQAQENVDFYTDVLGLRLVKKSVNQDDVRTYHLFFGDTLGHPGMDLTFFIFQPAVQGSRGKGMVTTISLAVPEVSLSFWSERLQKAGVRCEPVVERFGKQRFLFFDKDDQQLEFVGVPDDAGESVWITKDISQEKAIRHFYSAELSVESKIAVEPVLQHVFGYKHIESEGNIHLYGVEGSSRAHLLEVHEQPSAASGLNAAGTVHHIAFRAQNEEEQLVMQSKVAELGLFPTEVIDRFYFRSVYFRTPAGILFEIATDGPGFIADERESELGTHLALPPFLEQERAMIEQQLPPISVGS